MNSISGQKIVNMNNKYEIKGKKFYILVRI